ncbi:hypothetical protein IGI04_022674, partial [Brassica rapa subsp. trilocularis]
MHAAERVQPLADCAHPLASHACSWGKITPSFSINMGSSLSILFIQFQSKILREIVEREFPAKAWPIQPPIKYGIPRAGEEHGEPCHGSEGTWWAMAASDRANGPCDRTAALFGSLNLTASPLLVYIRSFLFFLIIHEGLCWFSPWDTSLDLAGHNQTANLDTGRLDGRFESLHVLGLNGWPSPKRHELPKVTSYQGLGTRTKSYQGPKGCMFQTVPVETGRESQGLVGRLAYRIGLVAYSAIGSRPKAGSGRSHIDSIRLDGLVFGMIQTVCVVCLSILDCLSDSKSRGGWLNDLGYSRQELRMVLVKPRSREGSVNDARDEVVIVYETIKKLCAGSHSQVDSQIVGLCSPHTRSQLIQSHGEAGKSKSGKTQKSKRTAGQSSQAAADGTNLSGLPTDPAATNTGDVLPTDQANLTGTQPEGQQHQESDQEVESLNTNRDGDQREQRADGTANVPAALSREDLLEAMKVMGNQVAAMSRLFTPLVNSSVGQATPELWLHLLLR